MLQLSFLSHMSERGVVILMMLFDFYSFYNRWVSGDACNWISNYYLMLVWNSVDLLCWYSVTAFSVLPPAMAKSVNMVIRIGIAIVEVRDLTILIPLNRSYCSWSFSQNVIALKLRLKLFFVDFNLFNEEQGSFSRIFDEVLYFLLPTVFSLFCNFFWMFYSFRC